MTKEFDIFLEKVIKVQRTGPKHIKREDISDFLFKITDGGRELCSVYTVRKNDSREDPNKRAGDVMKVTGKLGACKASLAASQSHNPELSTPVQYQKNLILTMCVTEVDGESYNKYPPEKRTRRFDVTMINKVEAGNDIYNVI